MNYKNLLYVLNNAKINSSSQIKDLPGMSSSGVEDIIVPSNKQLYKVDLKTRTIYGPETLSVQTEHYAETVYFVIDRYYDNMDLSQTNCVVQYVTDEHNYVYAVPFCDVTTYSAGIDGDNSPKMIIPWTISISATRKAGDIKYSIRFYLIDENTTKDENNNPTPDEVEFLYSLSTQPAVTKILTTLPPEDFVEEDRDFDLLIPERYFELINDINAITENAILYWIESDDLNSPGN